MAIERFIGNDLMEQIGEDLCLHHDFVPLDETTCIPDADGWTDMYDPDDEE